MGQFPLTRQSILLKPHTEANLQKETLNHEVPDFGLGLNNRRLSYAQSKSSIVSEWETGSVRELRYQSTHSK